jgi:hypothetical protein
MYCGVEGKGGRNGVEEKGDVMKWKKGIKGW